MTEGPYADFVVERRSAGTHPIMMFRCSQPGGDFSDPSQPDVVLYQMLRSEAYTSRDFGAGHFRHRYRKGDFDLVAPHVASKVVADGSHELIDFVLPIAGIRKATADIGPGLTGDFGRLHAQPFRSSFLDRLCQQLWVESAHDNPRGNLFADGALHCIIATLMDLQRDTRLTQERPKATLSDDQVEKIVEFISANLARNIRVADLARLADLSPFTFHRAFRSATGSTPYQFVLALRVRRAQELLRNSRASLAAIADMCGFSSQSHMSDAFNRMVGATPGRYRASFRT